jgi:RNA polymerase sigma-70 factor (ECF subfamily)
MSEQDFLQLIEANKGIVLKIVNLYADDTEDRKDLHQEIIFQCWKSYSSFKAEAKFSTWLYKISLNVSLTYLNKKKKAARLNNTGKPDEYVVPAELSERADNLYQVIRQLNEIDRGIIMLHLDGYDNAEIGEITGISKNNTGVKLHRIKQQLTNILNKK